MNNKSKIPSPCISICSVEEDLGWCRGCLRTLDEIAKWDKLNDAEKRTILALAERRRTPSS